VYVLATSKSLSCIQRREKHWEEFERATEQNSAKNRHQNFISSWKTAEGGGGGGIEDRSRILNILLRKEKKHHQNDVG